MSASRARWTRLAITSSASHPSTFTLWKPNASASGARLGHCSFSRSGREGRPALYSVYSLSLPDIPASQATITAVGLCSMRILAIIEAKP